MEETKLNEKYKELMELAKDYAQAAAYRREMELITAEARNKENTAHNRLNHLCHQLAKAAADQEPDGGN